MGRAIVRKLSEHDHWVATLLRQKTDADSGGRIFFADITEKGGLEKTSLGTVGIDTVIHAAGLAHQFRPVGEAEFNRVNVRGTENVVLWAARNTVRHFVLISTVSVYGRKNRNQSGEATFETDRCRPADAYGRSKLAAERVCREVCRVNKIRATILRPATVIGEGDPGNIQRLIRIIDRGRFVWVGEGSNRKSLIYKEDVAEACRLLLDDSVQGHAAAVYNLSAEPITVSEIVKVISEVLDRRVRNVKVPPEYLKFLINLAGSIFRSERLLQAGAALDKWLAEDVYAAEKFYLDFGFRPRCPPVEALRREVDWYLKQKC